MKNCYLNMDISVITYNNPVVHHDINLVHHDPYCEPNLKKNKNTGIPSEINEVERNANLIYN